MAPNNYDNDIDNQSAGNYNYDAIGNMISDSAEKISKISWTVYGKISQIAKTNGTLISYTYDASGNRISKNVISSFVPQGINTWFVRDASGNTMGFFTAGNDSVHNGDLTQTELPLYGSGRVGILRTNTNLQNLALPSDTSMPLLGTGISIEFTRGHKLFELSNHLGNVLVTVSDEKKGIDSDGNNAVDHYESNFVSAQDYYPFGMMMSGRAVSASAYRFGFNGKENDNEVKGEGNQQDYGFRIYDPRLGRFLSVDPLTKEYPELTPYQYGSNNPIWNIDLDGLEGIPYTDPKQMLYQAGADISQALGNARDRFSGFFPSSKTEVDKPLKIPGRSIVTTGDVTVRAGGNMESYIRDGRYASNNTLPKLKLSNFYTIETKTDSKVEIKQTVQAGNVKFENKVNVDGSSVESKVTVQNVKLLRAPVPVDISASNNLNNNGSKVKLEVRSSTKPLNVGGVVEVNQDQNGNVTGGTAGATFQVEKKTPNGTTIKNTTTVGKTF